MALSPGWTGIAANLEAHAGHQMGAVSGPG